MVVVKDDEVIVVKNRIFHFLGSFEPILSNLFRNPNMKSTILLAGMSDMRFFDGQTGDHPNR